LIDLIFFPCSVFVQNKKYHAVGSYDCYDNIIKTKLQLLKKVLLIIMMIGLFPAFHMIHPLKIYLMVKYYLELKKILMELILVNLVILKQLVENYISMVRGFGNIINIPTIIIDIVLRPLSFYSLSFNGRIMLILQNYPIVLNL
jgi:hypothetical protein